MSTAVAEGPGTGRAGTRPGADAAQQDARPTRQSHLADTTAHQWPDFPKARVDAVSAPPHLPWPDKAGLVIAVIVAAMSIYASAVVLIAGETVIYGRLNRALAGWTGIAELAVALPVWLLMRAVDSLTGGPSRRRTDRERRRV